MQLSTEVSWRTAVYCHEKYTGLAWTRHCEAGEEKGKTGAAAFGWRTRNHAPSPSHHTHPPSWCHTAFVYFASSRAWNGSCCFCLPIQIAQKILSILQKRWKFSTLPHS